MDGHPQPDRAAGQRDHDLARLRQRWGQLWNLGWDEEFVAVSRDGTTTAFAPTADALNQALLFDHAIRTSAES